MTPSEERISFVCLHIKYMYHICTLLYMYDVWMSFSFSNRFKIYIVSDGQYIFMNRAID